jgi:succinate-semialdehyde dehydrogenase/glutarate-semialdehyde dehydrogenase
MAIYSPVEEQLLVGGAWRAAARGGRFDVLDPATGAVVGSVPDGSPDDVRAAIDAAAAAFDEWRSVPARERARLLQRSASLVRERSPEIAATMTAEQGKPLAEAAGEVEYSASFFEWFAGEAERTYGQLVPEQRSGQRVLVMRQPVGVVAAITPWNFPAAMMARKLGPAIAAGCASVIKPAAETPLTAAAVLRCIEDAGAPPGLVNLITTTRPGETAETLFADPRVRKVSFTGSTAVGRKLIAMSATHVTRLSLELGGHAPYLVFDDADLERAADEMLMSKFRNAGQTCVCANRAYVQRSVYEPFVALLAERARALRVGPGTDDPAADVGPLIGAAAVDKVERHVADAQAHGARVVCGGHRLVDGALAAGHFYAPTVVADMTDTMEIAREETFGPALGVAPFDSEDEAVERANDTPYGLAAYVHTRDYGRVLRVAERLEYGIVGVDTGIISAANAPFGGLKESGYGSEGGAFGIDEYLDLKYVLLGGVSETPGYP